MTVGPPIARAGRCYGTTPSPSCWRVTMLMRAASALPSALRPNNCCCLRCPAFCPFISRCHLCLTPTHSRSVLLLDLMRHSPASIVFCAFYFFLTDMTFNWTRLWLFTPFRQPHTALVDHSMLVHSYCHFVSRTAVWTRS